MNPLKRCKRQPGGLRKQEKIEKTHKRGNFENLNIIIHNHMSKSKLMSIVMMRWRLGLMSNLRVTVCRNNQIVGFNTMTWPYIKTSWALQANNISKTKQNKWKANSENKLTRKHYMCIIKVIKKSKVKLIIFKDWIVQNIQNNMSLRNLIMKSRICIMICFIW